MNKGEKWYYGTLILHINVNIMFFTDILLISYIYIKVRRAFKKERKRKQILNLGLLLLFEIVLVIFRSAPFGMRVSVVAMILFMRGRGAI